MNSDATQDSKSLAETLNKHFNLLIYFSVFSHVPREIILMCYFTHSKLAKRGI